jgi:hypothetical protein
MTMLTVSIAVGLAALLAGKAAADARYKASLVPAKAKPRIHRAFPVIVAIAGVTSIATVGLIISGIH